MIMEEINKSINKQVGKYIPSQIGQVLDMWWLMAHLWNLPSTMEESIENSI